MTRPSTAAHGSTTAAGRRSAGLAMRLIAAAIGSVLITALAGCHPPKSQMPGHACELLGESVLTMDQVSRRTGWTDDALIAAVAPGALRGTLYYTRKHPYPEPRTHASQLATATVTFVANESTAREVHRREADVVCCGGGFDLRDCTPGWYLEIRGTWTVAFELDAGDVADKGGRTSMSYSMADVAVRGTADGGIDMFRPWTPPPEGLGFTPLGYTWRWKTAYGGSYSSFELYVGEELYRFTPLPGGEHPTP